MSSLCFPHFVWGLSILFIYSEEQALLCRAYQLYWSFSRSHLSISLIVSIDIYCSISFLFTLHFPSFSSSLWLKLKYLFLDIYSFWIYCIQCSKLSSKHLFYSMSQILKLYFHLVKNILKFFLKCPLWFMYCLEICC